MEAETRGGFPSRTDERYGARSKPRACHTLRNLNVPGIPARSWQNAPQCPLPSAWPPSSSASSS